MTEAENRFAQLIFKYEAFIDELAGQEETKYRSLISYDAGKVNHVISSQQAALMRLEQLDQKREAAAAEAGLSGLTLAQAAERIGGKEGERLKKSLQKIQEQISMIRFTNEKSIAFAKANLKALGSALPQETPAAYTAPGARAAERASSSLFEKKI